MIKLLLSVHNFFLIGFGEGTASLCLPPSPIKLACLNWIAKELQESGWEMELSALYSLMILSVLDQLQHKGLSLQCSVGIVMIFFIFLKSNLKKFSLENILN